MKILKNIKSYFTEYENIILLFSILFSLLYHILWWNFPLVRDEGEFATIAKQILEGIPLYTQSYNYKLPGVSFFYAFVMLIFGKGFWSVRFLGMLVNFFSLWVIYQFSQKLFDKTIASFSTLLYSILSNHYAMIAYAAMSEQFVVLFILLGLLFLLNKKRIFSAGLFFGLAFLMKQSAIFMLFIPYIYLLLKDFSFHKPRIKKFAFQYFKLSMGIFLPYLFILFWIAVQGKFENFWNWTVVFPAEYSQTLAFKYGISILFRNLMYIVHSYYLLWILAAFGFFLILLISTKKKRTLILVWSVLSFLSLSSGMYYRYHYFYFILPIIAISTGYSIVWILNNCKINKLTLTPILQKKTLALMGVFILLLIAVKIEFYPPIKLSQRELVRHYEGLNPYYEMPFIADKLKHYLDTNDKIVVFGSEAELYFYSKNDNASSYLFTYELVKPQANNLQMQKEMIAQITKNRPRIFLDVEVQTSWLKWEGVPDSIFRWKTAYLKRYKRIGLVEFDREVSDFRWNIPNDFKRTKRNAITIYERK